MKEFIKDFKDVWAKGERKDRLHLTLFVVTIIVSLTLSILIHTVL